MENKKINFNKFKEILKDNEVFYTMLVPIIHFLYVLIKSYFFSLKYSIPIEFVEINIKMILGNFTIVFCTFVFSLFILYILNSMGNNEKEGNIKLINIFFIFLLFEGVIILLILANIAYSLTRVTIWILTIVFFVIVIVMNIAFIFFKRNLFIIFIKYIVLIVILAEFIPENFKVITYKDKNKDTKKVIAMGYRDGEYCALDYDENKGEIYKTPLYSISASEIEEIELRKINDLKPVLSRKIDNISNEESGNNK